MMPSYFCITVRYHQPLAHGRGDGGDPEWPPSPLRLFQALIQAAAGRWNERVRVEYAAAALRWLEEQPSPEIIAAAGAPAVPYVLAVPNNALDIVGRAWSRGNDSNSGDANPATHRALKPIQPTRLPDGAAVHYLFAVDAAFEKHAGTLSAAARSITHLGWGVDMVVGNAEVLSFEAAAKIEGERWQPVLVGGVGLRVPVVGTFAALQGKHAAFLTRLTGDAYKPVPPLSAYRVVGYRRATDPVGRFEWAAFRIVSADPDAANPSFDAPGRARDVACWVRHACGRVCADSPDVATFVHGHAGPDTRTPSQGADRLLYLPLPTINHELNRVEAIRRVLVAGPAKVADRIRQVGRRLEGEELTWGEDVWGILTPLPDEWVLRQYTGDGHVWSTVTPVILPGHDDGDPRKATELLHKAFLHAGVPGELLADADICWRNVGFRAGLGLATQYTPPDKLHGRRCHVRVVFKHLVRGPLAVGAGRYRGLGVFAVESTPPAVSVPVNRRR